MSSAYCESCDVAVRIAVEDLLTSDCRCPSCDAVLVLVEEEPPEASGTPLSGERTDAPPLPEFDGGDTQRVQELANAVPVGDAPPLDVFTTTVLPPPDEDAALAELELVDVGPGATKKVGGTDVLSRAWNEGVVPAAPPAAEEHETSSWEESGEPPDRLFPHDPDWEALIDESLPELDVPDENARRVMIRLPAEAALQSDADVSKLAGVFDAYGISTPLLSTQQAATENFTRPADEPTQAFTTEGVPTQAFTHEPASSSDQPTQTFTSGPASSSDQPTQTFTSEPASTNDQPTQAFTSSPKSVPTRTVARNKRPKRGASNVTTDKWDPNSAEPSPAELAAGAVSTPTPKLRPARRFARAASPPPPLKVIESVHYDQLDPALVCARSPESRDAESYLQLYHRLPESHDRPRVVLVTSPGRRDGRTTVAANLSLVAARTGSGAVLVDTDLHGRGVLPPFGLQASSTGLLNLLRTRGDPRRFVLQFRLGNLDVVPLGTPGRDAAELLCSDDMGEYLGELRDLYPRGLIVLDGSPALDAASPLALSRHVDGVILVLRRSETRRDAARRAAQVLDPERLLGVVFNGV